MIVKILPPSATFKGVNYNTNKIEKDKGELMKVDNFGVLQAFEHLRPQDYINYLEARSKTSARIKYPQFHAVISCKGKSHSKEQLTELASQWLNGMGYGNQPYLLVFHKDTANNHIHMVSTRIDENGKKINDSYEKIRAYQILNQVMGVVEKQQLSKDIENAIGYNISTRAQFMMLLECQGYSLKLDGNQYKVFKFGKLQGEIEAAKIDTRTAQYQKDIDRLLQLRTITEKYMVSHNTSAIPVTHLTAKGTSAKSPGYSSELVDLLASKFGLQVLLHGKPGKSPYGYTLIDHAKKSVYKGSELMPIAEFIGPQKSSTSDPEHPIAEIVEPETTISPLVRSETGQQAYPDLPSGMDLPTEISGSSESSVFATWLPEINLDIANDIDDEAILGRNRQRKRKARTNTR
ncbi:relaxase/mobilization nuclease domain-containing protein [Pedobacter frigiditerrae]|uniref:relaxase/mobilization nuclease domain-containing protein n=1 Tax=Pedobacter frigiditerrae TaxID=2530452 RepID=UPI00292F5562|nr:relaxase/mobilization nuclease domain-containing protein [Pedobacter frigiditerrae]